MAWCPADLNAYLAGVLVPGPAPVTLEKLEWMNLVKVRLQDLIDAAENPKATIAAPMGRLNARHGQAFTSRPTMHYSVSWP